MVSRSKQTQAEAVKLKRIQKELQALDDMVSNDIGILRGKIEEASWDFTAARYQERQGASCLPLVCVCVCVTVQLLALRSWVVFKAALQLCW